MRVRARRFQPPALSDAVVIGADACEARAVGEASELLRNGKFSRLDGGDRVIGSILVRTALLRRIDPARLRSLIRRRIRRFMTSREVLTLRIEMEMTVTG